MISRRSMLRGLLAAPIVITTPGLLMPVKAWEPRITAVDFKSGLMTIHELREWVRPGLRLVFTPQTGEMADASGTFPQWATH